MEWISVDDQKPDHLQTVKIKNLCTFFNELECEFRTNALGFQFIFYRKEKDPITIYGITHWMPLPDAPKE